MESQLLRYVCCATMAGESQVFVNICGFWLFETPFLGRTKKTTSREEKQEKKKQQALVEMWNGAKSTKSFLVGGGLCSL